MDKIETAESEEAQGTRGIIFTHLTRFRIAGGVLQAGDAKHFSQCFGFVMHKPSPLEGVFSIHPPNTEISTSLIGLAVKEPH